MDKLDYVFDHVAQAVISKGSVNYTSLENCANHLNTVDGLGTFLTAQVVADMKNTPNHPLQQAKDWWTWSAPGPGSLRGLAWFFHEDPELTSPASYQQDLDTCRTATDPLIWPQVPRISNQDFQNCLCEFSKWCKVKYVNGHVRNKYDPLLHARARI